MNAASAGSCLARQDGDMADTIDPVELAQEIAGIASASAEATTARRLLELVDRLLTQAGLPPSAPSEAVTHH
jgi:hypothetical protein